MEEFVAGEPCVRTHNSGEPFFGEALAFAAYHWSVLMHGPAGYTCTENINTQVPILQATVGLDSIIPPSAAGLQQSLRR
jgi:hypothetical protein